MIILEGPDLGGKTTIGERLENLTEKKCYHTGGPPKNKEEFLQKVSKIPNNVICDRHPYISEIVYGSMRKNEPYVDFKELSTFLKKENPLILYCKPDSSFLREQLIYLKEKPHKPQDHVNNIKKYYELYLYKYEELMYEILKYHNNIIKIDFRMISHNILKGIVDKYKYFV